MSDQDVIIAGAAFILMKMLLNKETKAEMVAKSDV